MKVEDVIDFYKKVSECSNSDFTLMTITLGDNTRRLGKLFCDRDWNFYSDSGVVFQYNNGGVYRDCLSGVLDDPYFLISSLRLVVSNEVFAEAVAALLGEKQGPICSEYENDYGTSKG